MAKISTVILKDELKVKLTLKECRTLLALCDNVKEKIEILREIISNGYDAGATEIYITVSYVDNQTINLDIRHNGKAFENDQQVLDFFFKAFESNKSDDEIGGIGAGSKLNLAAKKIVLKNKVNNLTKKYTLENIRNTLQKTKDTGVEGTAIIMVETHEADLNDNNVELTLENIVVPDTKIFKHKDIREFINFYTISRKAKKEFKIYLKGITDDNTTSKDFEEIEKCEFDQRVAKIISIDGVSYFDQTGTGFGEKNIELEVLKKEYKKIMGEELRFEVLHFCGARDAKQIFIPLKELASVQNQGEFFGIHISINGIIVKERIPMTNIGGGSNGVIQYYAVFDTNQLGHTIDRNSIASNENNPEFLRIVKETMKLIDSVIQKKEKSPNATTKKEKIDIGDSNIIQGLFGELQFIYNNPGRIKEWAPICRSNADRKPTDFQGKDKFVEIKTKILNSSAQDDIIHINSIDQLDQSCDVELRVVYLNKYQNSSSEGITILELIEDVKKKLPSDYIEELFEGIGNYLNIKNFQIKYDEFIRKIEAGIANEKLLDRFVVIKEDIYKIDKAYIVTKDMEKESYQSFNDGYNLDLSKVKNAGFQVHSVSYKL